MTPEQITDAWAEELDVPLMYDLAQDFISLLVAADAARSRAEDRAARLAAVIVDLAASYMLDGKTPDGRTVPALWEILGTHEVECQDCGERVALADGTRCASCQFDLAIGETRASAAGIL